MAIPRTFEESFQQACDLAERFAANEPAYLSPKYQEAEVRQDFLDKFWVAIGWDVYHQKHPNPYEPDRPVQLILRTFQRHLPDKGKLIKGK